MDFIDTGLLINLDINHNIKLFYNKYNNDRYDDQDIFETTIMSFEYRENVLCEFIMHDLYNNVYHYGVNCDGVPTNYFPEIELQNLFFNFICSNKIFEFILERKNSLGYN